MDTIVDKTLPRNNSPILIGFWNTLTTSVWFSKKIDQTEAFASARHLATSILLVGLTLALVMAIAMLLLGRQIVRPILAIAHTAELVSKGDLTQKVPVLTQDEIGFLAKTFNEMIQQLESSYQKLSNYNRVLEVKVYERTQELKEKNTDLEQTLHKLKHYECVV